MKVEWKKARWDEVEARHMMEKRRMDMGGWMGEEVDSHKCGSLYYDKYRTLVSQKEGH